ncbi:MAG: T9SS type A sorting domain-containing protein [Bacteroidota bacterium]
MRKLSFTLLLLVFGFTVFGQNQRIIKPGAQQAEALLTRPVEPTTTAASTGTSGTPTGTMLLDAVTAIKIGEASNAYTALNDEPQALSIEPTVGTNGGTIAFIHRHNIGDCGGQTADNGRLRYTISTDGGVSWNVGSAGTSTSGNPPTSGCFGLGTLNPLYTRASRHPSMHIDNPFQTGDAEDLVLTYCGPALIAGSGFTGEVVTGAGINITNTPPFVSTDETYTNGYLFPLSLTERIPGEYWYVASNYNGTDATGVISLFKGEWDSTTNDVNWGLATTMEPSRFDVDPATPTGNFGSTSLSIGFDPAGKVGWVAGFTYLSGGIDSTQQVWTSESRNGGVTWSTPERFPFEQFPTLQDSLSAFFIDTLLVANPGLGLSVGDTVSDGLGLPGLQQGAMDLVVDFQGNPHIIGLVFDAFSHNGDGTYSVLPPNFVTNGGEMYYVDMTRDTAGNYQLLYLDFQENFWGQFGDPNVTGDEILITGSAQVTRSQDGELVFFHWNETDPAVSFGNTAPDMKGVALDVVSQTMTPVKNWTNDDLNFQGAALLPRTSQLALSTDSISYTVPTVITDLDDGATLTACNYWYFSDIIYNRNTEFTEPTRYFYSCASNPITLNVSETQPDCGTGNGVLTAAAAGGQGTFTYEWDLNGATASTPSVNNLNAGIYSVTATDEQGCTSTQEFILNNANAPSITIDNVSDISCAGAGDGTATVNPTGGTPTYNYAWSNGEITQVATILPAGTTQITVTDLNGCQTFGFVTINEPDSVQVSATATDALCFGELSGSLTSNATGGTGTLSYLWSNNAGTTPNVDMIGAGTYTLIVTDDNQCTASATVTIAQPAPLSVELIQGFNTQAMPPYDGSVVANPINGVEPFTYIWTRLDSVNEDSTFKSFADTVLVGSGNAAQTIAGQLACEYKLLIIDANGCEFDTTATISSLLSGASCDVGSVTHNATPSFQGEVSLFPNPSNGTFTIDYAAETVQDVTIEIYNLRGQVIVRERISNTSVMSRSFDMSGEGAGVYMIKLTNETGVFADKVVITQ